MEKMSPEQNIRRKEQIKAYKEGVANQHSSFGGTVISRHDNNPDGVQFYGIHKFEFDNAIPFYYVMFGNGGKVFYGEPGTSHNEVKDYIRNTLGDEFTYLYMHNADKGLSIRGRYFLVNLDAIPKECVIFTFWGLTNVNLMNEIVYTICKEKNFFNKEIFIANGQSPMIHWNDFTPGDFDGEIEDNSQQLIQHLLPPEQKHKVTEPYRRARGEMQGKKLGNMTQAEWNNIKYGYIDENRLVNEAGITELPNLPNKYFECISRYYNNGELTTSDGNFIKNTCKRLNEIFKYTSIAGDDVSNLTLRELFKKYGKLVEYYKVNKPTLNEGIKHHFDAAARTHYSISGEKLDKYCHVIDEVIDEMSSSFDTNKVLTKESLDELCSDVEVKDVMSSFDVQKYLNEKFWDENNHLNPRVRMRLLDIADKFYESLETSWAEPIDVIFTGSLCNYNWSKYSDVDLHIVVNFDDVDKRTNFVKDYFDTKKKVWNSEHEGLTIYGFPVELYVQDANEEHTASGVYSLFKDEWIVEPNPDNFSAEDLDRKTIASKVMNCADKIDELEAAAENETDQHKVEIIGLQAKKLFTKIKSIRKNALKNGGEYAPGNIWFKALRRLGYIGKLVELKAKTFDKMNTIK